MEFVCLGGFRNVRGVYGWNGLKLELDEMQYDFSISYEIKCESDDPKNVKMVLEKFLNENGVEYSYYEVSKFAVCRFGKLSEDCSRYGSENVNDNILVKVASVYGDARIHVEKEQEDLNRLLSSQSMACDREEEKALSIVIRFRGNSENGFIGDPVENVCCLVLGGIVKTEAAVCLCTTLRLKLLNLNIFIPLALQALITCGKTPPPGFICSPLT
ncbi:hypothetical protein IFM89_037150 [Coptis chinensis]|uniref:Hydrophobic seed protein domain-containing protein n=1 Tax=Coptis chinensis TaxID=261450 RepID=A0A835I3G5_9MAGN|nr:hypothetical protein IFM89_037150 [Coptis chinensis]